MENLFELLPEYDKNNIKTYIEYYVESDGAEVELDKALRFWSQEKGALYSLFGNSFILKKQVSFSRPDNEIEEDIWRECLHYNSKGYPFYNAFLTIINDKSKNREISFDIKYNIKYGILNEIALKSNIYNGESFELDGVKVKNGTKIMRILQKFANVWNLSEEFENFRIAHSQTVNTKKLQGELCLSIHPLDYMTMSDNASGWSSCMSWGEDGCYKAGTVEMMNSSCVIVAYLTSDKEFEFKSGYFWNNKKWRELFIVNKDIISAVKGYPYRHTELEKIVLNWLSELAKTNWNMNFVHSERKVSYRTEYMYNDIIDGIDDNRRLLNENCANEEGKLIINYSGISSCVFCGSADISSETFLTCNHCNGRVQCCRCEDYISIEDAYLEGDNYYCECCHDELKQHCEVCDLFYFSEEEPATVKVKISKDYYITIECCEDCVSMLYNNQYYNGKIHNIDYYTGYYIDGSLLTNKGRKYFFNLKENEDISILAVEYYPRHISCNMKNLIF